MESLELAYDESLKEILFEEDFTKVMAVAVSGQMRNCTSATRTGHNDLTISATGYCDIYQGDLAIHVTRIEESGDLLLLVFNHRSNISGRATIASLEVSDIEAAVRQATESIAAREKALDNDEQAWLVHRMRTKRQKLSKEPREWDEYTD